MVLAVGGGFDQAQLVPQPLDRRPGHEDGALQRILHPVLQPPGDGGHQAVLGEHRLLPRVEQQEAARPIGILRLPRLEAGLPEERRLLVPRRPGDGNGRAEKSRIALPIDAAAGLHLGQDAPRYLQDVQYLLVPIQRVDIEQHGPGGVGVVRHMDPPAGEPPDKPGLHRAEEQLPPPGPFPRALHMVQYPLELGGGKIGVDDQPRLLADGLRQPPFLQSVAVLRGPAALPDDGVVYGLPGGPVPDDGGLPLVGDADGGDIGGGRPQLAHGLRGHAQLGGPDLPGVMLHPSRLGEYLCKFLLGGAADPALPVEENAAVAGGPRVERHHVLCHRWSLLHQIRKLLSLS